MIGTKRDKRDATVVLADKIQTIVEDIKKWRSASSDARKELVENLKEAIRLLQRYLVSSLIAAGGFAALAWAPVEVVKVDMQLPVPISRAAALLLLGAVYVVTGLLASLTLHRAKHICLLLRQLPTELKTESPPVAAAGTDPLLIEAVLMYPSIPTMRVCGLRVGLILLPPVFVVAGIVKIFGNKLIAFVPIAGLILLCVWPIMIACELRNALGGELPDFHQD